MDNEKDDSLEEKKVDTQDNSGEGSGKKSEKKSPKTKPEPKPEVPEHWTVGKWKDQPKYECKYCPFDTLDEGKIKQHHWEAHMAKPVFRPTKAKILDRFGNEVNEIKE